MSGRFFRENAEYFFRAWVDFTFTRRPGPWLVRLGTVLLLALLAGWAFNLSIPTPDGPFEVGFSTSGTPLIISLTALAVALVFIGLGLSRMRREFQEQDRRRVIVIEVRGLRDTSGAPLLNAVPKSISGRRIPILLNLRQGQDGKISDPAVAVRRVMALPFDIANQEGGADRADVQFVVGGLAPVPFGFLVGVLVDDESPATLMDWNRHEDRWEMLSGDDDGNRFTTIGLEDVPASCPEVVMAVSVSYGADLAGIAAKFPHMPLVQMALEGGGPDAHWSAEKQSALARQFHEAAIALGNNGVELIHLVLAAPNSVVLRFGRRYDKRNLPRLIVYQYEKGQNPPYPWGVGMPVAGQQDAWLVT